MSVTENLLVQKSKAFALKIVMLYKGLQDGGERVLSRQLLRSGTSIGANIAEGQYAQSKADFLTKYTIALKEASETKYWLELLFDAGYLVEGMQNGEDGTDAEDAASKILDDCDEMLRLLTASVRKLKEK